MQKTIVQERIEHHLQVLVEEIGARPPGSPANQRATEHVRRALTDASLDVRLFPFTTRWWDPGSGKLATATDTVEVQPNPYSPPCAVAGHVVRVGSLAQMAAARDLSGAILVLEGALASGPVMPKRFPFYNPEEHRRLVAALEAARPAAVVAVCDQWQPVFEDADLPFPSTTVSREIGAGLLQGEPARLELGGDVHEGTGATVSGRTHEGSRLILSAHLDSKVTTPGAFDNAGGVAVLLALAELLLPDDLPVELVFFNGEDHFDACGELAWLAATDLTETTANVNVDGIGLRGRGTSLVGLACPPRLAEALRSFVDERPGWVTAEPWMESDHAIFAMQQIPAVAITSEDVHALLAGLAHGPDDTLEVVDPRLLAAVAMDLRTLLRLVGGNLDTPGGRPRGRQRRVPPR
jgi:aminopeptidase YwaD